LNKCLDLQYGNYKPGTKLHVWDYVSEGKFQNGQPIHIWDCDKDNINQKFVYENGSIRAIGGGKNFAFDVAGGANQNGTPVNLWTYDPNNTNQKFDYIRKEWDQ
jgi:hypothetical protein